MQKKQTADDTVYAPHHLANDGLDVGQRVFHQKFGYGRIRSLDGDKLDIDFEKAGFKKVMSSFVETT